MRVVFDIDDTISFTENRDYANAAPNTPVIQRIVELKQRLPDAQIVLHTSRGMMSCNGDVVAAEAKNRATIEAWIKAHGLPVDEIIFGKPFADLYVDDKSLTADEFAKGPIQTFTGFSGSRVTRIGDMCIKEADCAKRQYDWYRQAESLPYAGFYTPRVYSSSFGKLFMEYVEGESAAAYADEGLIQSLVAILRRFPSLAGENDLAAYASYVRERATSCGLPTDIADEVQRCAALRPRTFCHGDFSLLNILLKGDCIYLIDPSPKDGMDSWLLDAAKLRASLGWLDAALAGQEHDPALLAYFDAMFTDEELRTIRLVERTHLVRVLFYAIKLRRADVADKLREKWEAMR